MAFPTPADSDSVSTETTETAAFEDRHEDFEDYRDVIETYRVLQYLCQSHDVGVTDSGFARFKDAADDSPLAEHGLFYYRQKEEIKADLRDRRESGDLEEGQDLPAYKEAFPEPEGDFEEVTPENAEDFGIDADLMDDDEVIQLPAAYEPETDAEGNLMVWYPDESEAAPASTAEAAEEMMAVDGIGPKTAGRAANALARAGILPEN